MSRQTIDVARLPTVAFGPASLLWWGTALVCAIEGTAFALVLATELYLRVLSASWPPHTAPPPLGAATGDLVAEIASIVPMLVVERASKRRDKRRAQIGLVASFLLGAVAMAFRTAAFAALPFRWDTNAWGSVVWTAMGLHTFDFVAELLETGALTILFFRRDMEEKRFSDAADNALFWYFLTLVWVPFFLLFYVVSRTGT